jgi:FtsP/CotA-like multicopper oxidase with cupredoxin domain
MNKVVLAAIAAGVLIAGLIFCPVFIRQSYVAQAQVQATRPPTVGKIGDCRDPTGRLLPTKKVTLVASEKDITVAPNDVLHPGGIHYHAMVFNNAIPGPLIALTQGENLQVTLRNDGDDIHSLDFHMGYGTDQANSGSVRGTLTPPGHSTTWTICNPAPGAWFYHCSADMFAPASKDELPPLLGGTFQGVGGIWYHIANGMYGGTVVHPVSEKPAKEFYMVFSQLFTNNTIPDEFDGLFKPEKGLGYFSFAKFLKDQPDLMLTNGMAFKYLPKIGTNTPSPIGDPYPRAPITINSGPTFGGVFKVQPNQPTRWYIFNAGPNDGVAFHFIGTYQNDYYGYDPNPPPGHLMTHDLNDQVNWIPPAAGQVIETIFPPIKLPQNHVPGDSPPSIDAPRVQEALYVGVDHNMNHVIKGAAFLVNATNTARPGDQPIGTWVPPIDHGHVHIHCVSSEQQATTACPDRGPG